MTILSDKQIKELCTSDSPMLSPFHNTSIKTNANGAKLLSYGVSSYGYDATLASKIYVFTNQNAAIIDPRSFSEDVYVQAKILKDEDGLEYFILPPNNYALGFTNEYFKMPRDVTAICLGKSTYARCFTGDTKVALADGTSPTFLELIKRSESGERFFGYSVSDENRIVMSELTAPRKIGHEKVISVTLDDGSVIRATPDHKFITLEGLEVQAKDLTEGTSLMSLVLSEYYGSRIAVNHKVVSVVDHGEVEDVYCLTAPEFGNFALDAGVFVNNCAMMINATPIEAGWEGNVVLELANMCSLPIKVYINQGIAQFLFFKGDVCDTSYSDRGGKYQGQMGITLPKV